MTPTPLPVPAGSVWRDLVTGDTVRAEGDRLVGTDANGVKHYTFHRRLKGVSDSAINDHIMKEQKKMLTIRSGIYTQDYIITRRLYLTCLLTIKHGLKNLTINFIQPIQNNSYAQCVSRQTKK